MPSRSAIGQKTMRALSTYYDDEDAAAEIANERAIDEALMFMEMRGRVPRYGGWARQDRAEGQPPYEGQSSPSDLAGASK